MGTTPETKRVVTITAVIASLAGAFLSKIYQDDDDLLNKATSDLNIACGEMLAGRNVEAAPDPITNGVLVFSGENFPGRECTCRTDAAITSIECTATNRDNDRNNVADVVVLRTTFAGDLLGTTFESIPTNPSPLKKRELSIDQVSDAAQNARVILDTYRELLYRAVILEELQFEVDRATQYDGYYNTPFTDDTAGTY